MATPYDILTDIQAYGGLTKEYVAKQIHKVPEAQSVERVKFLLERCTGRTLLDIGCASGELHSKLAVVTKAIYGLDRNGVDGPSFKVLDIDAIPGEPILPFRETEGIDTILCGEVIEHLANPGWLLQRIASNFHDAELIITAPNAFSKSGRHWMGRGIENINADHVSWLSWHTLRVLVGRYGYNVSEWYWYGGEALTAEGLIFVCRQG